MKRVTHLFFVLAVIISTAALCANQLPDNPLILFSDKQYETSNIRHTVEILDFIVGGNSTTYSIVSLREYGGERTRYKIFVTENNKSRSFEFSEIGDMRDVRLGIAGFDDKGVLDIPFIVGNSNTKLYRYRLDSKKLELIDSSGAYKSIPISNAMYVNNTFFIQDKMGGISLIENGEAIKVIENIKIESIKDGRRQDDLMYFITAVRDQGNLGVYLIRLNMLNYEELEFVKLDVDEKDVNDKFEIVFLSKAELLISRNPRTSPTVNPSASLIQVNLQTNDVDIVFADESAARVIDVNIFCSGVSLNPITAYALNNGEEDDLVIKIYGKEKFMVPVKNRLFTSIRTEYADRSIFILSAYRYLVGRDIYSELSLVRFYPNDVSPCAMRELENEESNIQ